MRRIDAPEEIREVMGGWKRTNKSSEAGYGPEFFPRLLRCLEKLDFPGLELSHLMPSRSEQETP